MVLPLVIGAGGLAVSGAANLYKTYRQRQLYDTLGRSYRKLDRGYLRYLKSKGLSANPNRRFTSYYGQYLRSKTNSDVAFGSAIGSTAGTVGAGAMLTGKTWRYMK